MQTVAAVSFLNARPLVDGLENEPGIQLATDVPSRLLETLILGRADVALCPVIDFQLLVDAGSAADLSARPGTARLAMTMLDEGTKTVE